MEPAPAAPQPIRQSVRQGMAREPLPTPPATAALPPPRASFSQARRRPAHLGGGGGGGVASTRQLASHPKAIGPEPWLYGKLSREVSESILTDHGLSNGLFLVRQSASKQGAHAISVCHNGRIIHHLVTVAEGGAYLLNGNACGSCTSLAAAIAYLRDRHGEPLK